MFTCTVVIYSASLLTALAVGRCPSTIAIIPTDATSSDCHLRMSKPIHSDIEELYVINVLVMVETGPQTDQYYQLYLDELENLKLLEFLVNNFAREIGKDKQLPITNDLPVKIPNRNQFSLE